MSKYRGFTKEEEDALFETMRKANAYLEELLEIKKAEALAREKPPTFGPDYLEAEAKTYAGNAGTYALRRAKKYIAAYLDGLKETRECHGFSDLFTISKIRRAICGEKGK